MNETSTHSRTSVPTAEPTGGPWTRHTWQTDRGTRSWVTAVCARCRAVPWDEPLGMTVTFPSIEQARTELPRDLGWAVITMPGRAEQVLCLTCAALSVP